MAFELLSREAGSQMFLVRADGSELESLMAAAEAPKAGHNRAVMSSQNLAPGHFRVSRKLLVRAGLLSPSRP